MIDEERSDSSEDEAIPGVKKEGHWIAYIG